VPCRPQLCNHPRLLLAADADGGAGAGASGASGAAAAAAEALQAALGAGNGGGGDGGGGAELTAVEASGKLACLSALLGSVLAGGARAVVVSTSTATLDLVDFMLCQPNGWVGGGGW
jgi:hypothetical protein